MNQNTDFIPFARPRLGVEEEQAVIEVLRSGWLTTGKQCQAFEQDFAARAGVPHALAVNSATAGLHLALEALGIGPGDRIAVSPYTFTASCEVMRYLGAHPHFVDIEAPSFHMDLDKLETELKRAKRGELPPIKAIMPVHIGGVGWRVRELYALADQYGIPVIEDAAHAWPARSREYSRDGSEAFLGAEGTIGVYSFYANKTITTGEGGMIVSRNEAASKRMRTMRLHGIDREVWNRFTSNADQWRYAVVAPGYKYNLTDVAASIGCVQLRRADGFMAERRAIASRFNAAFSQLDWLELPPHSNFADQPDQEFAHSWLLYALRLKPGRLSIDRDEFLRKLSEAHIGTSVHFIPLHTMPYYAETYNLKVQDFPQAWAAFEGCFSLPIYPGLTENEVQRVIEEVRNIGDTFLRT